MSKLKNILIFPTLLLGLFMFHHNVFASNIANYTIASQHTNCLGYSFQFSSDKDNYTNGENVYTSVIINQSTTDNCHLENLRVGVSGNSGLSYMWGLMDAMLIGSNSQGIYYNQESINSGFKNIGTAPIPIGGGTSCFGPNCSLTFYISYNEVYHAGSPYPEPAEIAYQTTKLLNYHFEYQPFDVDISANPTNIDEGDQSYISWNSSQADSCVINEKKFPSYEFIRQFATGTQGNSIATGPLNSSRVYEAVCTIGGSGGSGQSLNTKTNFFTKLKNSLIKNVLADQGGGSGSTTATDSVVVTVNITPWVHLSKSYPKKDLVDAYNNDNKGIFHFLAEGSNTNGDCHLWKDNILKDDYDYLFLDETDFSIPFEQGYINSPNSEFQIKCNNNTLNSNIIIAGQDINDFYFDSGANGGCVNPTQGGSSACCVIQKGQSSCITTGLNWETVNPISDFGSSYHSEFKNSSGSVLTMDDNSGTGVPLGISTVDTPTLYRLVNKVDSETEGDLVENELKQVTLKSECAVGLSVINGVCDEDVSNLPDLIAQNIQAPGNVEGGQTFNVTTDIKNQGNARATEDPISVLFQATDTDPGQQGGGGNSEAYHKPNWLQEKLSWLIDGDKAEAGTVIEKTAIIHGGIDAGAIKNVGVSFSFPTVGNRWIRACADKASAGDAGVVTESYENNNCSSWKKVSVGLPDLIALSTQAASTVAVNTALSVSTTVKNQGNSDVNSTFYTLFQTTTVNPNGGQGGQGQGGQGQEVSWLKKLYSSVFGLDKAIAAESTPPPLPNVINTVQIYGLDAGASITKSLSMTFSTIGDKWIRTCADKKSASDTGLIHESIEGNNCSAWIKVTVTEAIPLNSDLQAGTPTPTVAVANTPVTFSSTISNTGSESTLVSFYNLFQTKPNLLSSDITDYRTNFMMTAIPGGQSKVAQRVITFTTAGTVYMRACADKSSQADATGLVHNESNENNNCSSWVLITISPTGAPDLTIQRGVIPTSAQVGVSTTFRTTVNNIGALTTGASFPNIFQVSSNASGLGAETFSAGDLSELQAGESVALSTNYTFANEGTYYTRFCADLNTRIQGVITEENENNNCSPWTETTITKDKEQCPNGAVNWPECTLDGDGDCINGALNPPQCDEFNNTSVAQCNNSVLHGCLAGVDENHSEGQDYYYWDCRLKDSVAHCFYPKNGGVGTGNGDEGNVTLTAVPSWIFKGRISTLTWSSWSGARCSIMPGEFTGLLDNGSLQMRPSETTTYTANCTDSTNTGQASATVKVINPLIFEQ